MAHRSLMKGLVWVLGLGAMGVSAAFVMVGFDAAHLSPWFEPDEDRMDAFAPEVEIVRVWRGGSFRAGIPTTPPIVTTVKQTDAREGLVLLSAGRDQEVEIGHELTVYRGRKFIGKVKVIKVFPDLAGAQVLFTKDGEQIQPGDKASTNI